MIDKHLAYIALGSNLQSPILQIDKAIDILWDDNRVCLLKCAKFYLSKPVGYTNQPDFINTVIEIKTTYSPDELLLKLQKIEQQLGRKRTIRWGPRVIDLDIILYDNIRVDTNNLTIPHPRATEREFVMIPLADLTNHVEIWGGDLSLLTNPFINHNMQVLRDVKTYNSKNTTR